MGIGQGSGRISRGWADGRFLMLCRCGIPRGGGLRVVMRRGGGRGWLFDGVGNRED
jgi:hypothetical protein